VDQLRAEYAKKGSITAAEENMLVMLRLSKIDRIREAQAKADAQEEADRQHKIAQQKAAFDTQMAALAKHLEQIRQSHQTAEQKIQATYADDVAHFAAAEEKKALAKELRFFDASVWLGHPEGFPLAEEMVPDEVEA